MGDGMDDMLSAARSRVGQEIGGKYRLEALVGVGGTAAVYAATHRNGHRVAVKISHRKVHASPALWARFLRESYLGNVLDHDGVVRVLDDDVTQDGSAYLVMELLQGASLRAIAAELPLDVAYVAAVGDAVLEVLTIAHQKGIVHRDVKPENIFLTDEGVLKLLDFGVARQLSSYGPAVTTTGAILGTPAFMAPEQVLGRGPLLGPPTDIWSVGATLFTLLSGQHVHEGSTTGEVFVSAATSPARLVASVVPGCPAALCAVIDRALRREISERWADSTEMRAALGEAYRAAFGKPLDAKALLGRMASELLPLVGLETSSGRADVAENDEPLTEAAATEESWSPPPRPPGPRASGYRDLPLTLRDATSSLSSDQSPRLKHFGGASIDGIAPTERAPSTPAPKTRVLPAGLHLLFQDRTLESPSETAPRSGTWTKTVLAAVGLVAASAFMGFGMSRARSMLAAQSEAPPAAAVEARASLPAVPQGGSEADVAYGEAFQLWLDGAPSRAHERFLDVTRLEPARAEAHIYAVVSSEGVELSDRDHLARARSLRGRLGEREAALLEALEPMKAEPPATAEAEARLEQWAAARPGDAIAKLVLAQFYVRSRRSDRLLELGPQLGGAVGQWVGAVGHLQRGEIEEGVAALDRCVAASPGAVDCLEWLVRAQTNEGSCVDAEKTARKLIAADHNWPNGYRYLARAIMGQTGSAEAARAVLRDRWQRVQAQGDAESRAEVEAADEFFLHVYEGEFDLARKDSARWMAAIAGSADSWRRSYAVENKAALELELGNPEGAAEAVRGLAQASRSWLPDDQHDQAAMLDNLLYQTGLISPDEYGRRRENTVAQMRRRGGYLGLPAVAWYETHVVNIRDARDAEAALQAEPRQRPLFDPTIQAAHVDARLGHMYLLGGRPEDAVRELRRSVGACWYAESLVRVRAQLWLGDALAQTNDAEGACRAYGAVIARWGRDGRSVTARAARERSKAAHCPR
jgi:serine/threonine protein kinase/predicted Zn-dependent protease